MPMIDGLKPEEVRDKIVEYLLKMASQGSAPSATAVLKVLDDMRQESDAETHRARMADLAPDPIGLAAYLGELGCSTAQLEVQLGRAPTDEERAAHERGAEARRLEVRAIQLGQARRGQNAIETWMKK